MKHKAAVLSLALAGVLAVIWFETRQWGGTPRPTQREAPRAEPETGSGAETARGFLGELLPTVQEAAGARLTRLELVEEPAKRSASDLEYDGEPYRLVGTANMGRAWLERLKAVLLDDDTYSPPPMCLPTPGVKVRLTNGSSSLDIWLCFECDMAVFETGEICRWTDFGASRKRMLDLCREAFPKDKALRSLPDQTQ